MNALFQSVLGRERKLRCFGMFPFWFWGMG